MTHEEIERLRETYSEARRDSRELAEWARNVVPDLLAAASRAERYERALREIEKLHVAPSEHSGATKAMKAIARAALQGEEDGSG